MLLLLVVVVVVVVVRQTRRRRWMHIHAGGPWGWPDRTIAGGCLRPRALSMQRGCRHRGLCRNALLSGSR